ncbi:MAG: ABC transporter permease [Nanoarchaeota archaeon]|mgnify:CR=1 FL=1
MAAKDKYEDELEIPEYIPEEEPKRGIFSFLHKKEEPEEELEERKDKPSIPISKISASRIRKPNIKFKFIKLRTMIKKDFKVLLRSRTSALIVFFGPLLIILLVGLAFNSSNLYNLKVASYSASYSDLTNSVLDGLRNELYTIVKMDSVEECQQRVRFNEFQICTAFPPDLNVGSADNTVIFYVDESRLNLAHLISSSINNIINKKKNELSIDLTKDLLSVLSDAKALIEANIKRIDSLIDSQKSSLIQVDKTVSEFSGLDLEYNSTLLNISVLEDVIRKKEAKQNESFTGVYDALDDVKLEIEILGNKLTNADLVREISVEELKAVREKLVNAESELLKLETELGMLSNKIGNIKITDAGVIVNPINTNIEKLSGSDTHLSFLFPTLLVMVIMFISILLSSTVVMKEKLSPAYFRNFIDPTGELLYMIGTFLTNILLVFFQLFIILIASIFFLKSQFMLLILPLFIMLVLISMVFILIGMLIGYMFKSEETSTLGSIAVASILLLFSNTILPLESIPGILRSIFQYNPFIISEGIIKKIVLFNEPLSTLLTGVLTLAAFVVVLFILCFVARIITKNNV